MNNYHDIIRSLPLGTVLTIGMDSGNIIGPVILREFNRLTDIVTVEEQGVVTGSPVTTIQLPVFKIEYLIYPS